MRAAPPAAMAARGVPKTDAGLLRLGDGRGARVAHGAEHRRAVLAHPGEQDADGVGPCVLRDRVEEDVDRGALVVDARAVLQAHDELGAGAG